MATRGFPRCRANTTRPQHPAAQRSDLRVHSRDIIDDKTAFSETGKFSSQILDELWNEANQTASAKPDDITQCIIATLNDVIDFDAKHRTSSHNHIPP